MEPRHYILAINCGSSGIRFTLFNEKEFELTGDIRLEDTAESHFRIIDRKGMVLVNYPIARQQVRTAVHEVISWFHLNRQRYPLAAIGHRVVLGGPDHRCPCIANAALLKTLQRVTYLAPNHLPGTISTIKAFLKQFPDVLQAACFDTFFHSDMPEVAKCYALPSMYRKQGLVRYGFHGLSCEYIMLRLQKILASVDTKNIIIAHLGNGASITAIKNGKSIDTTMGISPMGGIVMGTRPGDLDPGVLLFLLDQAKLTPTEISILLSENSGLKAIAGHSNMELLLASEDFDSASKQAVEAFCYQAQKAIGALAAALGGLDVLVFTGGIGQNSAEIRRRICKPLAFLGIGINRTANEMNRALISPRSKKTKVYVLATNEEIVIAAHTRQLLQKQEHHDRIEH